MALANLGHTDSFALYVAYAPIRDLPATPPYYCPVTVLEWNTGHITVLPPVAKPGSLMLHRSHPLQIMRDCLNAAYFPVIRIKLILAPSNPYKYA